MSILGRVADLFHAKTNKLLNALEDPNDTLDLSYEKMLTGLQETKRHLADVVAQQKSLERQIGNADAEVAGAEGDARLAVQADRDDLARAALVHRQRAVDNRTTLQSALDAITPQIAKLADYQQRLEDRIERFRTQKDTMKASYAAAQAQVKVTQSLTGVGDKLSGVGDSMRRAEDKMLGMRDKADAMDSLMQQGLLNDPTDNRSATQKELADLRDTHLVDAQLEQLKADLKATPALSAPAATPQISQDKTDKS
ncbi:MAG TPA: PspA/IM30 family protein [Phenylobacterium sp.]|jgi:phage shock protein A|uniref:PspA/IM30 family protein n=1 Tax=Phenylobacterium sp. TaxID=1871053 RepID=UPI002D67EABF|nr:PspA/IM30 family protein [Phenylobacterium sp.]HZZ68606.1 PspA/IM30 family protein [Phenylobacterium sp.]